MDDKNVSKVLPTLLFVCFAEIVLNNIRITKGVQGATD